MHARHPGLSPVGPVFLVDLLPGLHDQMMNLLRGLAPTDWGRPTACTLWSVKDIAAHLLDGSLRRLSFGRDRLGATPVPVPASYAELVAYLNRLNAEWVAAARRLSSRILMDLLDSTAPQVHAFLRSLDPHAAALFPVAWAGEDSSPNWFDIGREYTERWLHQQQIREAVGAPGLTGREWLAPTLDIFMRALPFTYRDVSAEAGQAVRFDVEGEAGGVWTLLREDSRWRLFTGSGGTTATRVRLDQETAWKLFSKGLGPERARERIQVDGDPRLAGPIFRSLAVMA